MLLVILRESFDTVEGTGRCLGSTDRAAHRKALRQLDILDPSDSWMLLHWKQNSGSLMLAKKKGLRSEKPPDLSARGLVVNAFDSAERLPPFDLWGFGRHESQAHGAEVVDRKSAASRGDGARGEDLRDAVLDAVEGDLALAQA